MILGQPFILSILHAPMPPFSHPLFCLKWGDNNKRPRRIKLHGRLEKTNYLRQLINLEKSSNVSPVRFSAFSMRLKKQFGISFNCKFLLIHGLHPLSCLVGCSGQFMFLQVQKLLILFINIYPAYLIASLNTETIYSAISQSCASLPPPTPIPPAIFPSANSGYPPATSVMRGSFV